MWDTLSVQGREMGREYAGIPNSGCLGVDGPCVGARTGKWIRTELWDPNRTGQVPTLTVL